MKRFYTLFLISLIYIFTFSTVSFAGFDDTVGHWCEDKINSFRESNFVEGYEDNTFRPNKEITRAELCKIVNAYMDYPASGEWKEANMTVAKEKGYLTVGKADETISREESFTVLARVMNTETIECELTYLDSGEISVWTMPAIKSLTFLEYIKGYNDGSLKPKQNITRTEVISILHEYVGAGGVDIEVAEPKFEIGYLSYNKQGIEFVAIEEKLEMELDETITLAATLGENDGDVMFEIVSGNELVDFDSEMLMLEALSAGEVKIKATTTETKIEKEIEIIISDK